MGELFAGNLSELSGSVFLPHVKRPVKTLVNPYRLAPSQRTELVKFIAKKLKELFSLKIC